MTMRQRKTNRRLWHGRPLENPGAEAFSASEDYRTATDISVESPCGPSLWTGIGSKFGSCPTCPPDTGPGTREHTRTRIPVLGGCKGPSLGNSSEFHPIPKSVPGNSFAPRPKRANRQSLSPGCRRPGRRDGRRGAGQSPLLQHRSRGALYIPGQPSFPLHESRGVAWRFCPAAIHRHCPETPRTRPVRISIRRCGLPPPRHSPKDARIVFLDQGSPRKDVASHRSMRRPRPRFRNFDTPAPVRTRSRAGEFSLD